MLPPTARPNLMARATAPLFSTGSTPGSPRSTAQACVLGAAPNLVEAPEKILDFVESWVCVSSPMTTSHSIIYDPCSLQKITWHTKKLHGLISAWCVRLVVNAVKPSP